MIYRNKDGIILELRDTGEKFFNGEKCTLEKKDNDYEICINEEYSFLIKLNFDKFEITPLKFIIPKKENIKIKKIKEKLIKNKIKEKNVYKVLDTYDDNTDYFEDNILITIINHSKKQGFVVSKYNTYAGFYCFVSYYILKINDIENIYKYEMTNLFSLDGFSVYKESYEDNVYTNIFYYDSTKETIIDRYFAPQPEVISTMRVLTEKYNLSNDIIGVYYRGTDKKNEIKLPDINSFIEYINKCASYKKILLQTDQEQIVDIFYKIYNTRLITIDELPRSSTDLSIFHTQTTNIKKNCIELNAVLRLLSNCNDLIITDNSNVSAYIRRIRTNKKPAISIN